MFDMVDSIEQEDDKLGKARIKVIGIGGGGCNAVNTMIREGLKGVDYIVANTDAQALKASLAPTKIQLGIEITKGLGAGANPEVGRKAALEEYENISKVLEGADMIFITAGMGGGTGTGAAPVVAKLAKEMGTLTVGVVTKPFLFEGKRRFRQADEGIISLEECVDSLITIPNQKLLYLAGESLSLIDTFKKADEVLLHAVQGISDLINNTGLINADFADVSTVMANKGLALMGTGVCAGADRAIKAATEAISSPLLEDVSIDGATGIIINITGDNSLTTHETNEAVSLIMEAADEDAEIIFGTVIDDNMGDEVKVTVIATGLGGQQHRRAAPPIEKVERPALFQENPHKTEQDAISLHKEVERETPAASVVEEKREEVRPAKEEEGLSPLMQSIQKASSDYKNKQEDEVANKAPAPEAAAKEQKPASAQEEPQSGGPSLEERLSFINFDEDEFDAPAFLRRDQEGSKSEDTKNA